MDVFARAAQVQPKTDTVVFYPHFGNPFIGVMICVVDESFSALLSLSILGFWVSIRSQRRKLWIFEVNWHALVQIELLLQFLYSVHIKENF